MIPQDKFSKTLKEADDFLNSLGPLATVKNGPNHLADESVSEADQAAQILRDMIAGNKGSKPLNQKHLIFICEMIAHGNRAIAYRKAYPDSSHNSAYVNACRLLAQPHIANYIRELTLAIRKKSVDTVKEKYDGKMADIEEKRKVLAKIIRGEYTLAKEVTKDGEPDILRKPDMKDVLRAIIVDNKMEEEWMKATSLPDNGIKMYSDD